MFVRMARNRSGEARAAEGFGHGIVALGFLRLIGLERGHVFGFGGLPCRFFNCAHRERDALFARVDFADHGLDFIAHGHDFAGVCDALARNELRDVDQPLQPRVRFRQTRQNFGWKRPCP